MTEKVPYPFEYHTYLKRIVGAYQPDSSFFIATEADFAKGGNIDYPYRSYFYSLGLMHQGNCRIKIGVKEYEIKNQSLTIVGPGIVRHWLKNDWKVINHTFFFTSDFFQPPFHPGFLFDYPFFKPGADYVLQLSDEHYANAKEMIRLLEQNPHPKKVQQGLFYAFLELIHQVYSSTANQPGIGSYRQDIVNRFNGLLHHHYREEKEVNFYAGQLAITTKHFSEIVKKETGLTAKQNIDAFVMFEAKSLLRQTRMSSKEIAYSLGFESPSYFVRLFKKNEGITPLVYRNRAE